MVGTTAAATQEIGPMIGLVKKLIEKITVFADHFTVEFKSGITIDIEA